MSEKRKDNKGRILRTGESQRKDLIYQYRYTDIRGKRQTVYSSDLKELREKEKEIQKQLDEGIDYAAGKVTVIALLERYISLKQGVRYNTKVGYNFVLNLVKKEDFGNQQIRDIKLTDVVPNDSQKRIAMTDEQQKLWMDFIREDKTYSKYFDEFVVLLQTGMRVSEFCGLTKNDLDFEKRRIRVDHQLVRERGGKYYVEKTKTESGCRFIPMTDEVYHSLLNILANRRKVKTEMIVDGYSNFILIDKDEHPKVALHIENEMRWAMKKYKKLHSDQPLPNITPHVFRHTFCTNMANAGMDVKTLQYLMGHSDVGVTLNIYTHASYDRAAEQMAKIVDFKQVDKPEQRRKSG